MKRGEPATLFITAEQANAAHVAWFQEEMKQAATRRYDLGKFLLTISVASMGAGAGIVSASKADVPSWRLALGTFLVLQVIAACFTLQMIFPTYSSIRSTTDLFDAHKEVVQQIGRQTTRWLIFWFLSVVLGGVVIPLVS